MSGRDIRDCGASFLVKVMAPTACKEALTKALNSLLAAAVLVLVVVSSSAVGGSVNDCHGVRYAYRERGLDLKDVPRQPRQGEILAHNPMSQIMLHCIVASCMLSTDVEDNPLNQ